MKNFLKEFKDFIATGNLVELAAAFILALAIKAVIDSFINDVVMQIVAAVGGKPDFSALVLGVGDAELRLGAFLNTVVSLLVVGFVLFHIVKAYNRFRKERPDDEPSDEVVLLTQIRDALVQRNDRV